MKKTLVDLLLETQKAKKKYFENYKFYCQKIKNIAKERLKEARVLVFGSIIKKKNLKGGIKIL